MKGIFPEIADVDRPTLRGLLNHSARARHGILKLPRGSRAALSVPRNGCQIFLLRFGMEPQRLSDHQALLVDPCWPSLIVRAKTGPS